MYDRTRLAAMQLNTTVLTLAWYFTDDVKYAEKAIENIRVWFLDSKMSMNPHLNYAQIPFGSKSKSAEGKFGIIEMKDVFFMLDAVRLLYKGDMLNSKDYKALVKWFTRYIEWIKSSSVGQQEYLHKNNHGLYYDIQVASIASFVQNNMLFFQTIFQCPARMFNQIVRDGRMPYELKRPNCEHYQMFTLQGWYTMNRMASKIGLNYWKIKDNRIGSSMETSVLCNANGFAIPYFRARQECPGNSKKENLERWWPLWLDATKECSNFNKSSSLVPELPEIPLHHYDMNPLYSEPYGIAPFWNLGYRL